MNNIYSSAEAVAWSRDFCYIEYEKLCSVMNVKPMCVSAYLALCGAFRIQMEHDIGY